MRINTSMMIQQTSQSNLVQKSLSKVMQKLALGKRITTASDDAAGLSIAKQLESMSRGYKTAGANIEDASAALNIADGGASAMSDILQRQRDLATQASSDTLTNQDRQALNQEYQALNQEIGRISGSTQYNTQDLLSGQSPLSDGTGTLQVGPGADGTSQLQTPNVDMSATAIGAGGDISTGAGAQSALDSVSKALDNVSAGRSRIGAMSNRLEYANRNNANMNINTTDALSRMEDLDYAQATMELARDNILSQSTMKTIQNFNQISRNTILGLLQ